jgi:ABC-type branched-subunit amino acid transport system substrate-binding protein
VIGLIADQTGSTKPIGNQFIRGAKTAAKLFGPINGRPVKFIVEDGNGFSASTAAAKAIKLKNKDRAVAIIGMAAGECSGAQSVANRVQLPMIGTSCVIQEIVGKNCNPWFYNGDPSPLGLAQAMKVVLPDQVPGLIGSRWAVIGDDPGWSQSVADYWNQVPGAKPAGVEIAPFGTTDWGPYIAKLEATKAKALLLAVSFGVQYPAFLQQANAAGLLDDMRPVAPLGFPENGMVPGYGERASQKTVDALLKVDVVWQYGAPWTEIQKSPQGKKYVDLFYKTYKAPPAAQANMQMNNTWRMLTAIKEVGTDPKKIAEKLATPIKTPYYDKPQGVQSGSRQIDVPAFVTKLKKLPKEQYGVQYANEVQQVIPASKVIGSAQDYGCKLPSL